MFKQTKLFFFILCWGFFQCVDAAPVSCPPVGIKVQNNTLILPASPNTHSAQIIFLKNISTQSIWLDHPVSHPSASAGWSSYLRPGNWAAFLNNRKNFTMSCSAIEPGNVRHLDCAKVVSVCFPEHANLDTVRPGTYWLAEDQSWESLLKALEKRGVIFKN